ncbi:hypothetical protein A9Q87_13875 [Flavobacteriales bacterium 34_180_T64]|nr:hypothetical protein A9Q87_13875 [Flavobacteriales bacterium 34_180_T64]
MATYSLEKLFGIFKDLSTDTNTLDSKNYMDWVQRYVEIAQPDFVSVMDIQAQEPLIYQKNYNLEFSKDQDGTIQNIIDGVDKGQVERILTADTKLVEFTYATYVEPKKCTFHLRFNATLIPGNPRSFLRTVTILERGKNDIPKYVLTGIFDITELHGSNVKTQIDIKNFGDNGNYLDEKLQALKMELTRILQPELNLTKREKNVLQLISQGKTSDQIAVELNISVSTVNTHRQNLIKKNNVKNTSALLHTF